MELLLAVAFDIHAAFLQLIYSILNASLIFKRDKTHLTRNEMRGGNLYLSGTVHSILKSSNIDIHQQASCNILHSFEVFCKSFAEILKDS